MFWVLANLLLLDKISLETSSIYLAMVFTNKPPFFKPSDLFGCTFGWPGVVTAVANWFGKAKKGFIMGVWNSHTSVGNILGSLIAGKLPFLSTIFVSFIPLQIQFVSVNKATSLDKPYVNGVTLSEPNLS